MESNKRKSHTTINKIYFLTATIDKWLPLLESKENKGAYFKLLKEVIGRRKDNSVWLCNYAKSFTPNLETK